MPPKKKGKGVVRAASTPGVDDDVMAIDTPQEPGQTELPEPAELTQAEYSILQDPWTDEQETSLYKGVIKWKPAGAHSHSFLFLLN
jgi:MRG-binding protein